MFASYMETVSADAEFSEPTDGGTKSAPESRVEPNLRRVKLNIGHLIIWGFTSGIISFLAGSKARNIIPNELKPRPGPTNELEKLKKPLAHLNPKWFTLEASLPR